MTNRGYGVFVDSSDNVSFEVASEKVEYVGFSVPGESISYYFFYGPTPKQILNGYTALTGRPALPPAWSFGLWLSTSFTTNYNEETTSSFIDGMIERGIPLSVFHFDCFWMKAFHWCDFEWDKECFPDIRGTLQRYHEKGLKICAWINPYIAQGTAFFREGMENGYLLKRADGKGVWQTDNWQAGMGLVDFTNPDAVKWYTGKLRTILESRLHGSGSYRVPWLFDEEACDVVAAFTKLKCRLMPYLYAKAIEAHEEGTPVMRPMVFEYTTDPAAAYLDTQYMLGESLLVSPIFREDGVSEYYLPAGKWTHLLSGEVRDGGCWQKDTYDYFSMPMYVRENTLLAIGAEETRPDYDYAKGVSLRLYQPKDGETALCMIPSVDGSIVNRITAVKDGVKITVTPEKELEETELTVYIGTEVKKVTIPAGVTEFTAEV